MKKTKDKMVMNFKMDFATFLKIPHLMVHMTDSKNWDGMKNHIEYLKM